VSLTELRAHLGHSSAAMTQRYAHLIPGTGDNARSVLDGAANFYGSSSDSTRE